MGRHIHRSHTHTRNASIYGYSHDMLLCYILQFIPLNEQPCSLVGIHLLLDNTRYCAKHHLPTKASFIVRSAECEVVFNALKVFRVFSDLRVISGLNYSF